ncbi:MAG: hypothetical protein KZQ96_08160 [Candidatus Thiodiazotropha sp. (ex Lucinoma borealis)]|nr:hypothetical protein [Candidatus Thiodiazotropha sp. (ex Lucinoma borealis)]
METETNPTPTSTFAGRSKGITGLPRGVVAHRKTLVRLIPETLEKIEQIREEHLLNTGETLGLAVIINSCVLGRLVKAERPRKVARWGGLES